MASATKNRGKSGSKTKSGGMAASKRNTLKGQTFAFPKERKEPLNDAKHVRNAIARFDQVEGVSSSERDAAWRRIRKAAKKYGVEVSGRPKSKKHKPKGRAKTKHAGPKNRKP